MTNFTKTRLTDKGLALLAKTGVSVTVTKVKTGNGEYQTDADIGAMTELKSEKQEFQITSTQKKTDTTYAIKFVMSNKELAEDYLFTEIGIYASDPDEGEILYAVCYAENKDADMIRKYSGLYEFKAIIVLNIQVNAGGVVNVVEQGLYALAEDLEELREEVGDKVDKEEGKGLSHNDFTDADRKKLDGIDKGANKTVIDSELNSYSSNPVQNQVVYEEMLKRMAQKWVGSHLYTLYGIVVPSTVNGANTGSHYLDVKTGNTYIMTGYTDRGAQAWTNTGTLQSVEEILNSKFDKSNIANNLVTTEEGYVADARQLNKSVENSFAYEMDKSISAINDSLTQFTFVNVVSGMRNYTAFYNSITKMMFVSFNVQLGNRATASEVAILNDHAHTIDGNAYMFPVSAWDGVTGNIVLSYGYISGQDIKIYVPPCGIFSAYGMLFYHCV